jgi:threonyl-tRNA synthetase
MLVVGEKEAEQNEVSVRQRGVGDKGSMKIEAFMDLVAATIEEELSSNV